jgi:hypothetical protein
MLPPFLFSGAPPMTLAGFNRLAVGLTAVALMVASEAWALEPKDLVGCPFTEDVFQAATGVRVKWRTPGLSEAYSMHTASCTGLVGSTQVTITQTLAPAATAARRFDAILRTEVKGSEAVPGDPDGARWLAKPEFSQYTLAYIRGAVLTRIVVQGPESTAVAGLKAGLLSLKRVP